MLQAMVITSPFMVCLFWTAVLVLEWRSAYPAKRLLAVFMSVCAVLYLCHAVFFTDDIGLLPAANVAYSFCNLAVYPLYYLYIFRLTHARISARGVMAALLPATAVCLWTLVADCEARMAVQRVLFVLQLVPVSWFGLRHLYVFDREIANNYADTELRTVKQTRVVMGVLVMTSLCSAVANYVGREYFAGDMTTLALPSAAFSLLLFAVGYVGMKQTFSADMLQSDELRMSAVSTSVPEALVSTSNDKAYNDDAVSELKSADTMARRLSQLMEEQHLYLQPDLRLVDVAQALGVGRSQLSSYINQTLGMSFSDYINQLRVCHAQRLIASDRDLPLLYVSEQSGFSTEAVFYRAFRKYVGKTPRQWSEEPTDSGQQS